MEMQQLRYVVAVARTGNFSRAAEQCHVSQPSLSQQILKLEEELGERLFNRMKREVKLTPHGEGFLRHAIRALEEVESAKREAKDATALLFGTLMIGVLPTIAPYLLPRAMVSFVKKYPGVELIVQEDTTPHLLKLLLACEIDFALASLPIQESRLEVRELFTEDLLLALPTKHALAKKKTVCAADLHGEQLVVMKEGHCLGDQVLHFCDRRDLRPNITFRSAQLETIQSLVSAGMGLSLVPEMATKSGSYKALKYKAFVTPRPTRKIVAVWAKDRPLGRAANEFLKGVEEMQRTESRVK